MTRSKADVVEAAGAIGFGLALAGIAFSAGCASMVAPLAVKLGADLISSASANYSQAYANKVQDLMQGVYAKATQRVQRQETASSSYASQAPYGSPYPTQTSPYPQGSAYPSSAYPSSSYPSAGDSQSAQGPYPSGAASPYPSAEPSPSPYPSAPYGQASYGTAGPIVLDAAILAQRASDRAARRTDPVPIQDGDTLRDGGSDPRKGDVTKFSFRVN